ncbi:hypothetical protein BBP40_005434 [Aspergillus hancockii]|nr:hypothetical protein BBP40_005434 [Aspergillus hancockii]
MYFKIFITPLFIATASASWVQLCGPGPTCTDTGSANKNTCIGPIGGKGSFTFKAHDFTPKSMSIFRDKGCFHTNLKYCDKCKSVTWNGQGPVYGIFH